VAAGVASTQQEKAAPAPEEEAAWQTPDAGKQTPPKFLIHTDCFGALDFQFIDGTKISAHRLRSVLNIPQNEQLLRTVTSFTIATRILNALVLISATGVLTYAAVDLPHSDVILPVFLAPRRRSRQAGFLPGKRPLRG
jgi:hypothetical protein